MITITVDNRLRLDTNEVPIHVVNELRNAFTHKNPSYQKLKAMGYAVGDEPQYIHTLEVDEEKEEASVPRGGTQRLREILRRNGLNYRFEDRSLELDPIDVPEHRLNLYPYQQEAVEACFQRRNCILRSPTGSGKTTIMLNLITRVRQPTLIIVWSKALAKQWIERLTDEFRIPPKSIGRIMAGKVNPKPITVGMQQTIYRRDPAKIGIDKLFGLVMCDEVQRFAARTFRQTIEPFHAKWRIGASADETRNDGKEFLIYDVFGGIGFEISSDELVEDGYIHDVVVKIIPTKYMAPWYKLNPDFKLLTESMALNARRNELIMDTIEMALEESNTLMVFSHRIKNCRVIDSLCAEHKITSGLMLGTDEWAETFDETKEGLKSGKVKVGIGTIQAIGQGIDIPAVDSGVVITPLTQNRQQFNQVAGRMCRTSENKEGASIYYLWDRHVYGLKGLRKIVSANRSVVVLDTDGLWVEGDTYIKRERAKGRARGILGEM